jgi:hypothetical protein
MAGTCDEMTPDEAIWERLSQKQALALAVLLDGGPAWDAADAAKVSRATVYRWARKPAFKEAFRLVRAERRRVYLELKKLLDDPETERHIRIRAAEDLRDLVRPADHEPPWRGLDKRAARPIQAILP